MNYDNGFIVLHRKFLNWEWYSEPNCVLIFIHCLLKANWKDKNWKGNLIKRGSFITSINHLAQETNLTVQQTRTALKKLQSTGELTCTATNKHSLITIVNYDIYQQLEEEDNKPDNNQITNEQQTNNKQITTTEQGNNINNINNKNIGDFENHLEKAVQLYNDLANEFDLPKVMKFSKTRKSKLKARLKDCGGIDGWITALEKIRQSNFLTGDNKQGWKADFDFILQEKSFNKIMEGSYDNRKSKQQHQSTKSEFAEWLTQQ